MTSGACPQYNYAMESAWLAFQLALSATIAELDQWPPERRNSEGILHRVEELLSRQFQTLKFLSELDEHNARAMLETMRQYVRSHLEWDHQ